MLQNQPDKPAKIIRVTVPGKRHTFTSPDPMTDTYDRYLRNYRFSTIKLDTQDSGAVVNTQLQCEFDAFYESVSLYSHYIKH